MFIPSISIRDFPKTFTLALKHRRDPFPYSGIEIFTGGQGMGKTLHMVEYCNMIHKKCPEAIFISNIDLKGIPYKPYDGLSDFEDFTNGELGIVFVLDEIQNLYSSMQSHNVSDEALYIWTQNRKNRRVILGTTQRFTRVAKPIREQTRYLHDMRGKLFNIYTMRTYDGYSFDDNGVYTDPRPSIQFSIPPVSAYLGYDTYATVARKGEKLNDY